MLRITFVAIVLAFLEGPAAAESLQPEFVPPHTEQLVPGIFAVGFSHRFDNANCGWVAMGDRTLLIDLPRGLDIPQFVAHVKKVAGKPVRAVALTSVSEGDEEILKALAREGVERVETLGKNDRTPLGDESIAIEFIPYGKATGGEGGSIFLPRQGVLFGGPAIVNGPRIKLPGSDTSAWLKLLDELRRLKPKKVVPGFGTWGGPQIIDRDHKFLGELRQQVAHGISMGLNVPMIMTGLRLPHSYYAWMPYDLPIVEDVQHVYRELTAPISPYGDHVPDPSDPQPHALVLIGDRVHEPEHAEEGLRPVFEATRVVPHFTVDYRALTAENLSRVSLLVIQRDGMIWPDGIDKPYQMWMTPEQEMAVVEFVQKGGAFLNLHNSMGLYPENGPYLKLVGGRYTGHGPLERFRVQVTDHEHPVTIGVKEYFIADEQHTPVMDENKARVLLTSRADDGTTAPAGWAYEPGRGRLVHLANGHTRDALNHPMFQKLMRNSVKWLLHCANGPEREK